MKILIALLLCIFFAQSAFSTLSEIDRIIPKPRKMERGEGTFILTDTTRYLSQTPLSRNALDYLQEHLKRSGGYTLREADTPVENALIFNYNDSLGHGNEAYLLHVSEKEVVIEAADEAGFFYGMMSLMQLMPPAVWSEERAEGAAVSWPLPACTIKDYPRFSWRGMMLDSSRNFFPKEYVKKFIDRMAQHKLNVFHWHLSDDEGWQIEIRAYPLLTQTDIEGAPSKPPKGYYTQQDVKEIVAYARKRSVEVLPEIDTPAHSLTAVTAYPALLQDPDDKSSYTSVQGYRNNTIDVGLESSYTFLGTVIKELTLLFPFGYFHLGGDEVPRGAWQGSPAVAALMQKEQLKNSREVADYFFNRMDGILARYGRTMVAWQEVRSGNAALRDGTIIMAWRGDKAGVKAAKSGHKVVMAPAQYLYFDQQYVKTQGEPGHTWAGAIDTEKAYAYDPVPKELTAEEALSVVGVHGCLWSETLLTQALADYMAWPRIFALAEIGWSAQQQRRWDGFKERMIESGLPRLAAQKVNYRRPGSDK